MTLPHLAHRSRVLAPDVLGFGYTERPASGHYDLATWTSHLSGFLDALGLERVSLVGNSFGGALALSLTTKAPERVDKLVLMGSVGVPFELTPGLDAVWGFEPSAIERLTIDEGRIRAIRRPTLLVHGRDDRVIPLSTSLRLHELIDHSRLQVFDDCGHWVQIEQVEAFHAVIAHFLAGGAGGDGEAGS